MHPPSRQFLAALSFWLTLAAVPAVADEGMWLFNDLPTELLQEKYDFTPTEDWTRRVMLSSVRFNSGGSASFVSADGLVLTNHHVGADTIYKLSTPEHNYVVEGFYAESLEEELKAPDLELNQLISIEDVTEQVASSVTPAMSPADAFAARRAVMAKIEEASLKETGLRSDVITLYGGGRYHLYRYKKYTDVRLVWAPETAAAFFGGDPDNFEYPRYCLDATLFRVYEDGKPARIGHYLEFAREPIEEGQLVFVSGNPGRTDRLETVEALKYRRDALFPFVLDTLRRREILLQQYGYGGREEERRARDELFGVQNSRKARMGMLAGLQDPSLLALKAREEKQLRAAVADDPKLRDIADAWQRIAEVQERRRELLKPYSLLEAGAGFRSRHFEIARTLVRMAEEDQKPNPERLSEYAAQNRESLLQELLSPAPTYDDLEQAKLADSLGLLAEVLGGDDPLVQEVLDGQSPRERAADLIEGTQVDEVEYRRKLAEGGLEAIRASDDPMIELARLVDPTARELREKHEEITEIERQAYAQIADARFAVYGTDVYPDATFTLRLAFGQIRGYREGNETIPPWTTFGGAFEHEKEHGAEDPWELPESWQRAKDELNLDMPLNFVSTVDIIGGNSGSPVIDRDGRLVGLIFDGNIYSLTQDFIYTEEQARAVSVYAGAILEALNEIYGAERLVRELRP